MNKEQAAAFIGVSVRTLQRIAARGDLGVSYMKGEKGDEAIFDEAELQAYKENPPPKRNRTAATAMTVTTREAVMPVMTSQSVMTDIGDAPNNGIGARLLAVLEAQTAGQKILLSLKDCHILTGLSGQYLREQIQIGKLKGRIIGKGYKVKRTDLDAFIRKL